jgi:hypothetical protein
LAVPVGVDMRIGFGGIGYANLGRQRARKGLRAVLFGSAEKVLRVSPWSFTDDKGTDWMDVLPLNDDVPTTRLDPRSFVTIRADSVLWYQGDLSPAEISTRQALVASSALANYPSRGTAASLPARPPSRVTRARSHLLHDQGGDLPSDSVRMGAPGQTGLLGRRPATEPPQNLLPDRGGHC